MAQWSETALFFAGGNWGDYFHFFFSFIVFLPFGFYYLFSPLTLLASRDFCENVFVVTGLPVRPSYKFGFRSSVQKSGPPGEGRHEGLVPRKDVLTNGFIGFSLARTLARILFVPRLCPPAPPPETQKALRT